MSGSQCGLPTHRRALRQLHPCCACCLAVAGQAANPRCAAAPKPPCLSCTCRSRVLRLREVTACGKLLCSMASMPRNDGNCTQIAASVVIAAVMCQNDLRLANIASLIKEDRKRTESFLQVLDCCYDCGKSQRRRERAICKLCAHGQSSLAV